MFCCIYCKKTPNDVEPSEAHIFPHALGGTESTTDTVCQGCNSRINREVETPIVPSFSFFRSWHGVVGRRGVPGVPATARVEGYEAPVTLGPDGRPKRPIVRAEPTDDGKKKFFVYGTEEMRADVVGQIAEAHPTIKWRGQAYEVPVEVIIDGPSLGDPLRRLAAKVAFERFAQIRGSINAVAPEFYNVREFVLTGAETQLCSGITADPELWNSSSFGTIPVPAHAVVVVFHRADPIVGAFVMFFGMFLCWVILSRRYQALGSMDDLLVEWPHVRVSTRPVLRGGIGAIRVPWDRYIREYTRDPASVVQAALQTAQQRFQRTVDAAFAVDRGQASTP